jgi:hypothetical protein
MDVLDRMAMAISRGEEDFSQLNCSEVVSTFWRMPTGPYRQG